MLTQNSSTRKKVRYFKWVKPRLPEKPNKKRVILFHYEFCMGKV